MKHVQAMSERTVQELEQEFKAGALTTSHIMMLLLSSASNQNPLATGPHRPENHIKAIQNHTSDELCPYTLKT